MLGKPVSRYFLQALRVEVHVRPYCLRFDWNTDTHTTRGLAFMVLVFYATSSSFINIALLKTSEESSRCSLFHDT